MSFDRCFYLFIQMLESADAVRLYILLIAIFVFDFQFKFYPVSLLKMLSLWDKS